jgi:hypothetical protein
MDFVNTETLGVPYEDIDERVLEHQIVENIRKFILTFGDDFIFMGNQYRIAVAGEGLFIDLLFFNRDIDIILCREMNKAFVEIAIQDFNKPMGVATYRTSEGMPEKYQKALPDIDELCRILESEE